MRRSAPTTTIHRPQAVLRPIWRGDGEENLIRDAAMDTDTDGDGVVDSFSIFLDQGSGSFTLDGTAGAQKISLTGTADSFQVKTVEQVVLRVFPGDQVTLSVDVKAENVVGTGAAQILIRSRDASGLNVGNAAGPEVTSSSFGRVDITVTAGPNVAFVAVQVRARTEATNDAVDAFFRDARLLRASSDPATYANPHVDGASQTGASLDTAGWPASTSIIKEGDVFLIGGSGATQASADPFTQLYRATSDVSSDSNGDATIPVDPEVTSPTDGAALRFHHGKPGVVT